MDTEIRPAVGRKCRRCWQTKPEVGEQPEYGDVCARCAFAVRDYDKAHSIARKPHPQPEPIGDAPGPMWTASGPYLTRSHKDPDAREVVYAYDWTAQEVPSRRYWIAVGMDRNA